MVIGAIHDAHVTHVCLMGCSVELTLMSHVNVTRKKKIAALRFSLEQLGRLLRMNCPHYNNVIMGSMVSQITTVYSAVYSGADQRKHQSSASLAFVPGIHRGPVHSPHKWPVTRKMFPFDDVVM